MSNQKYIKTTLKVSGIFNTIAALSVAFPDTIGKFAELPPAGSPFHTALLAALIFITGIIYFRMAYSEQADVPLLIIAGIGKAAIFFIALYYYFNSILSFAAFSLAIGDLLFGVIFLGWVMFGRGKE